MSTPNLDPMAITTVREGDLSSNLIKSARQAGIVAWDIETTGLDWEHDSIEVCQVCVPKVAIEVVRQTGDKPEKLCSLLADASVRKVFHHAMFDLRFIAAKWGVIPANITCTKIASKLLFPDEQSHNLKGLLAKLLGIKVSKELSTSNWGSEELTPEQVHYAASDVAFLPALLQTLEQHLKNADLSDLAHRCFEHIPTRIELDIRKYSDVYTY